MKFRNIFVALTLALSLSTAVIAQDAPDANSFGNAKFGSTKEEVKAVEKDSTLVLDHNDELIFNEDSEFMGKSQNCYTFDKEGKLVVVTLNIINDHKDLANYIADYDKINEAFKQIYGEPDSSGYSTEDQELLKDPAKLAQAIKDAKVSAATVWKKENFTITHVLAEQMPTDDMDEETKKATVINSICHLVLAQHNSYVEEEEGEDAAE